MFTRQKHSPIGIDIGKDSIKLVQFRSRGDGLALLAAGKLDAQFPGTGNGNGSAEQAAFIKDLKKLLTRRKFGARRAVVALPVSDVDVRPLTLPSGKQDIAKMVRWEANSYLGYDAENAIIDHIVLGEAKSAGETRLEVLATAVEKGKVLNSLNLLSRAGIIAEAVDIVPLALCRLLCVSPGEADSAAAAVDIGAESTHAVIVDNQELRMSRTIDIGGDALTQAISTALEIDPKEAQALKHQHGAGTVEDVRRDPENPSEAGEPAASYEVRKIAHIINDILRDKLDLLAEELSKLLRYFSAQNQGRRVERVLLVGGTASLKHLDTLLTRRLGAQVEVGAPITRITGQPPELKGGNEGAFAVATGLALRGA